MNPSPPPQPIPPVPPAPTITPADFTGFLHSEIPLTRAMGMTVAAWDGKSVTLAAPLGPNQNHADTGFGGAISTMGIMAGYSLLHLLLQELHISNRLLIQKSSTDYLRPIDADFTATACLPEPPMLAEFLHMLRHRRRARLSVVSQVQCKRMVAATHTGLYVAMLY